MEICRVFDITPQTTTLAEQASADPDAGRTDAQRPSLRRSANDDVPQYPWGGATAMSARDNLTDINNADFADVFAGVEASGDLELDNSFMDLLASEFQ